MAHCASRQLRSIEHLLGCLVWLGGSWKPNTTLCKCEVLCKSICVARASAGWAGPTGEEPEQEVTAATPQQPPCAQSSLAHAKLISRLLPHAAARNKCSLSLKTALMLPSFSFQELSIFCLGSLSHMLSPNNFSKVVTVVNYPRGNWTAACSEIRKIVLQFKMKIIIVRSL